MQIMQSWRQKNWELFRRKVPNCERREIPKELVCSQCDHMRQTFGPFGKKLKFVPLRFLNFGLYLANFSPTLAKWFLGYWANIHNCKWPNY